MITVFFFFLPAQTGTRMCKKAVMETRWKNFLKKLCKCSKCKHISCFSGLFYISQRSRELKYVSKGRLPVVFSLLFYILKYLFTIATGDGEERDECQWSQKCGIHIDLCMCIQSCAALFKKMFCVNKYILTNVEIVFLLVAKIWPVIDWVGQRGCVHWFKLIYPSILHSMQWNSTLWYIYISVQICERFTSVLL